MFMKRNSEKKDVKHLGLIIDGNRRWAKERGLSPQEGHKRGYEKILETIKWHKKRNIKTVTIYAFSTENWKRSKEEVDFLMNLLISAFKKDLPSLTKKEIKVNVIGLREELPEKILRAIKDIEKKTSQNKKGTLNIAFNYGGRLEIVEAIKKIINKKIPAEKITEDLISKSIWTAGQSDPDLIIRTSGEQRLSGFLTWQSVYSELYFCKKNWPDFSEKDLDEALEEYQRRNRRFGGN